MLLLEEVGLVPLLVGLGWAVEEGGGPPEESELRRLRLRRRLHC